MTPAERSRIAKENASHSTGPKTHEGKQNSRKNSIRHGLTATILTLPDENPEDIQAHADGWLESCQPETSAEGGAVTEAALAMLQLGRFHKAQQALAGERTRYAATDWDRQQKTRLSEAVRLLPTDPENAVLELKSFGAGVNWLTGRWRTMLAIFEKHGCWNNAGLVRDVIRLCGLDPTNLRTEPIEAYGLFVSSLYACPEPHNSGMIRQLEEMMPPEYLGLHGRPIAVDRADAQANLLAHINAQMDELQALAAVFEPLDEQSRAEASLRALAPADTAQNKLLLRYQTASSSAFGRAVKTLETLQTARQAAERAAQAQQIASQRAAAEAAETALRNEAERAAMPSYPPFPAKGYVTIDGKPHWCDQDGEGEWRLTEVEAIERDADVTEIRRLDPVPERVV